MGLCLHWHAAAYEHTPHLSRALGGTLGPLSERENHSTIGSQDFTRVF